MQTIIEAAFRKKEEKTLFLIPSANIGNPLKTIKYIIKASTIKHNTCTAVMPVPSSSFMGLGRLKR